MRQIKVLLSKDLLPLNLICHPSIEVEYFDFVADNLEHVLVVLNSNVKLVILSEDSAKMCASENSLKSSLDRAPILVLYSNSDPALYFEYLMRLEKINHLISICSEIVKTDIDFVCDKLFSVSERDKSIFDMMAFSKLEEIQKFTLIDTRDRRQVYQEIQNYADSLGCFSGFSEMINTVASELITNAFYDGKRHHSSGNETHGYRYSEFALDSQETIKFMFGKQDGYLWVIVQDPFGSVDRDTLVKALYRASSTRTAKLDSKGGAGLGLIMLYEWCSGIYFHLSKGVQSTVACKLKITSRNKIFSFEKNSLHFFIED